MITYVARSEFSETEWDSIVLHSPDGWVFALYGWQELILGVPQWGLQDHSFAVALDGKIAAVVPLQFHPASRILGISAWGGCGPILSGKISDEHKPAILSKIYELCSEIAEKTHAVALEFSQPAATEASVKNVFGVNHSVFFGFEDRSGLTQVIDLKPSVDDLWKGLSKNARNIIRRAEKAGITARRVPWPEHLDNYYRLHCETYFRTGVTPHPIQYFSGISEKLAPLGYSALFAAFDRDGDVLAYHNDACLGPGVLYHTGCSADSAQDTGANYLLLWTAIVAAKEDGRLAYEVGPIFPGTDDAKQKGLTLFKTRFGGSPRRAMRSRIVYPRKVEYGEVNDQLSSARYMRIRILAGRVAARFARLVLPGATQ